MDVPGSADSDHDGVVERLRRARPTARAGLARRLAKTMLLARVRGDAPPRLGRYELREQIGSGGMGTVFRAWDPMLERDLAIKVLSGSKTEANDAMIAEARVLARLSHPNILAVHDIGIEEGQLWMAMELVPEGNLRQWVERRRPDWRTLVRRFAEAARGLAFAHGADIVHRDIKPENLLVGSDGRTRVADFGLAVGSDLREGVLAGTPQYLPPEATRGAAPDPRWDQYSTCLSLGELLASHALTGDPAGDALVATIDRGTAVDPAARFPSMDALADALEALVARPLPDPRHRLLLDRVERMWITGVLESSLAHRRLLDVRVSVAPDAVDAPLTGPSVGSILSISRAVEASQRAMLLLGDAGAGKTTALLLVARDLLRDARDDASAPTPVVLNLSSFSPRARSFAAWAIDELVTKYGLSLKFATGLLADAHALILLLDGLDEVNAEHRAACVDAINAFRRESGAGLVVACRDQVYRSIPRRLNLGCALQLEPLDLPASELSDDAPRSTRDDRLMRTPLMHALVDETRLPSGADEGALFEAFVGRAIARMPRLESNEQQLLRARVSWLARTMQRVGASDVWLERLQADWLEGPVLRFSARALGLALIALVLIGGNTLPAVLLDRPLIMGPLLGAPMLLPVLWFSGGLTIRPRQAFRWSTHAALKRGVLTVVSCALAGFVMGLNFKMVPSLTMGVAAGLASSVLTGFVPGDSDAATAPGEGLRQSLRTAARIAIPGGAFIGCFMGLLVVPLLKAHPQHGTLLRTQPNIERNLTLQIGTSTLLASALIYGGAAVLLHLALRIVLALGTPLPLRLIPFLNAAADRGLLRRLGGGWMFQHKLLLEHLATRGPR